MKTLCIFPHFSTESHIPYYVEVYVHELSRFFDEVLIVTNDREIDNEKVFDPAQIKILKVKNQGYDFGKFYKGFQHVDISAYSQIACINDSNILFGDLSTIFNWSKTIKADMWGLVDANIRPSYATHADCYHLQSHFLVFNKAAIDLLPTFFSTLDLEAIFDGKDIKAIKRRVINDWEIGLSQFMLSKGLRLNAFIDHQNFTEQHQKPVNANIFLTLYPEVIAAGIPLLKKKVITSVKWRDLTAGKHTWQRLIKRYGSKNLDIKKLVKELKSIRNQHFKNRLLK